MSSAFNWQGLLILSCEVRYAGSHFLLRQRFDEVWGHRTSFMQLFPSTSRLDSFGYGPRFKTPEPKGPKVHFSFDLTSSKPVEPTAWPPFTSRGLHLGSLGGILQVQFHVCPGRHHLPGPGGCQGMPGLPGLRAHFSHSTCVMKSHAADFCCAFEAGFNFLRL